MSRITMSMLRSRVDFLNQITKGRFEIGSAYGGYRLERVDTDGRGVLGYTPYTTKREVLNYINAFIDGIYEQMGMR